MCLSGGTCLTVECCVGELALQISHVVALVHVKNSVARISCRVSKKQIGLSLKYKRLHRQLRIEQHNPSPSKKNNKQANPIYRNEKPCSYYVAASILMFYRQVCYISRGLICVLSQ
jgi:hypothetical protein